MPPNIKRDAERGRNGADRQKGPASRATDAVLNRERLLEAVARRTGVGIGASHSLADAAIGGINARYANTGFIGFPLALADLEREALAPTPVAPIITACALFALGVVLIETGLQTETRKRRVAIKVGSAALAQIRCRSRQF